MESDVLSRIAAPFACAFACATRFGLPHPSVRANCGIDSSGDLGHTRSRPLPGPRGTTVIRGGRLRDHDARLKPANFLVLKFHLSTAAPHTHSRMCISCLPQFGRSVGRPDRGWGSTSASGSYMAHVTNVVIVDEGGPESWNWELAENSISSRHRGHLIDPLLPRNLRDSA